MKDYFFRFIVIAILVGIVIYLVESTEAPYETDWIDVVDAVIDSGMEVSPDLSSPAFLASRMIVTTTDINASFSKSLIAQMRTLDADDASGPIDLYLRTEGGWEADAYAVIDTMKTLKSPVNVHAMGEVHSAGAMILAAGTGKRYVYENTILGFHALADDEEPPFDVRYLDFWKDHAQLPEAWLEQRDNEMMYFTAEEAIEMGVADEILLPH